MAFIYFSPTTLERLAPEENSSDGERELRQRELEREKGNKGYNGLYFINQYYEVNFRLLNIIITVLDMYI